MGSKNSKIDPDSNPEPCEKFASEFLAAIESANPLSDPALSLPETQRLTQFGSSVFAFPLLPAALCRRLVRHLESLQTYYSFAIDPTGIVLDNEPALRRLFQTLAHRLFVPLLQRLAGPDAVLHVAYQHALCVRFDALGLARPVDGACEGHGHPMHTDAADLTLNVCLSEHFAGGALVFHREDGSVEQVVERRQGDCVVHNGRRLHSDKSLDSGTRYTLELSFRFCFGPFLALPEDLQLHIVSLTDFRTALAFCRTCHYFDDLLNRLDVFWLPFTDAIRTGEKFAALYAENSGLPANHLDGNITRNSNAVGRRKEDDSHLRHDIGPGKKACFVLDPLDKLSCELWELEAIHAALYAELASPTPLVLDRPVPRLHAWMADAARFKKNNTNIEFTNDTISSTSTRNLPSKKSKKSSCVQQ